MNNKPFVVSYGEMGNANNHEEFENEKEAITYAVNLRSQGTHKQITVYKFTFDGAGNIAGQQSIWYYRGK